nr:MAG TPA: hypothetical protein [Caudoviricetes sp.]
MPSLTVLLQACIFSALFVECFCPQSRCGYTFLETTLCYRQQL